ncbi:MAG TPA: MFS transporter [Beijerinckiaceae bacterium]|nr:MFS transporter [Beijerinckiaceae bacterium]
MQGSSSAPEHLPDSAYAWRRLAACVLVGTMASAGMWTVVVALPTVQAEFGTARAGASLPYTALMIFFGVGTIIMGRAADRFGLTIPVIVAAVAIGLGYVISGMATSLTMFTLAHGVLIGFGGGAGFAPLMSDISHWFVRRRALAVTLAACGSYLAGTLWPLVMNLTMPLYGWRATHVGIGLAVMVIMLPLAFMFRVKPSQASLAASESATAAARADLGIPPGRLQAMLTAAGLSCCIAMSMPQVHIVAYCGDLGYGVARGAEMLSLMLGLGIVSRIASGFLADRIGGPATLMIGSLMQGMALLLYLFFDGLSSLYLISAIFGLFQGGIVPMYAVIAREFLPPREAGARIGIIISATIVGMAVGGYLSGLIFDLTSSYRMAFLHGLLWNFVNLALTGWLVARRRQGMALAGAAR